MSSRVLENEDDFVLVTRHKTSDLVRVLRQTKLLCFNDINDPERIRAAAEDLFNFLLMEVDGES
jgi:hypothetical protein